jgi:hypothetical protein
MQTAKNQNRPQALTQILTPLARIHKKKRHRKKRKKKEEIQK